MSKALLLGVLLAVPAASQSEAPVNSSRTAPETPSAVETTIETVITTPSPLLPKARRSVDFEVVEIRTSDKVDLEGSWYKPRGSKGKRFPGVLLVHDAGGNREQMAGLAERLVKSKLAVLTIDLRGHGGSSNEDLDWTTLTPADRKAQWVRATQDVAAAVDWLLSQDEVHSTKLCMVGHRAGCALVVRHMKEEDNACAVALLEPPAESFGFNVKKDLLFLEGIPTYIVGARGDDAEKVSAMVDEANSGAKSGDPYIEFLLAPPPVIEDRGVWMKVTKYLQTAAVPSKGK